MTNNKAATGFIVKSAARYVASAAAPFVISLGVSSVFPPPVEAMDSVHPLELMIDPLCAFDL